MKPKALTVTVDGKSAPVEVGRAIGGGKVTMFKLNHSPAARQLEDTLANWGNLATDIPTRTVNVHIG